MAYTFADLKEELRANLFPTGEADNLVIPHDRLFEEAMFEIQQKVVCQQNNNTTVFEACSTLFKCGMTVFDRPRGRIRNLYVIDRINQTTGREDAAVPLDYCSIVNYRQVTYQDLDRYISQSIAKAGDCFGFAQWFLSLWQVGPFGPLALCPWAWGSQWSFPPPDDAGLQNAPPLPIGYHYAQPSTDVKKPTRRAQFGLWAIRGAQIFVTPWIQSTEAVVVEWDGIKRNWDDIDLVDNDPLLKRTVEAYVRWQHEAKWGHDDQTKVDAQAMWQKGIEDLMYECRQEHLIRDNDEQDNNQASGSTLAIPTFTNDDQTQTAQCPSGLVGDPITVTIKAGTVVSTISKDDANSIARSQALQQAGAQIVCNPPPPVYSNTQQTFTATCAPGTGTPVTVTIPAGQFTSLVSQADADAQALAAATSQAQAQIQCVYGNTEQSYTATCPQGTTGGPFTVTVPANTFTASSQSSADALALQSATNQAIALLSGCSIPPTVFWNTLQTGSVTKTCGTRITGGSPQTIKVTIIWTVAAHEFSSIVSQADANNQAVNYGNLEAQFAATALCPQALAQGQNLTQPLNL